MFVSYRHNIQISCIRNFWIACCFQLASDFFCVPLCCSCYLFILFCHCNFICSCLRTCLLSCLPTTQLWVKIVTARINSTLLQMNTRETGVGVKRLEWLVCLFALFHSTAAPCPYCHLVYLLLLRTVLYLTLTTSPGTLSNIRGIPLQVHYWVSIKTEYLRLTIKSRLIKRLILLFMLLMFLFILCCFSTLFFLFLMIIFILFIFL